MEKRLYLRAFEYSDLPFLNTLRNDDELTALTGSNKYYISSEWDKKWIEDKIFNNYKQLYLMVCSIDNDEPIGYICATNIDYINRKAAIGGIVITKEFASKGYATEALTLLLNHLYEELGMNMVYAFLLESQKATMRLLEKFGCKIDGLIRDYVYKQGEFQNAYITSLLKAEFNKGIKL